MSLRQIFRVVFEDDVSECQPLVEAPGLGFGFDLAGYEGIKEYTNSIGIIFPTSYH